jgi:hypothetical protein
MSSAEMIDHISAFGSRMHALGAAGKTAWVDLHR